MSVISRFKSLFSTEEPVKPTRGYNFTDEDRQYSAEIRAKRKEYELMKLQRQSELDNLLMEKKLLTIKTEIQDLTDQLSDNPESDEEPSSEMDLIKLIIPLLTAKNTTSPAPSMPANFPSGPSSDTPAFKELSTEQLIQIWQNTPKNIQDIARKSSDEQVKAMLAQQMPDLSPDSISRALEIIRAN